MRIRSKGKLVSTKVIDEETFRDYLAMAGTAASMTNAPEGIVSEIANHTKCIDATVVLNSGQRLQITIAREK